MKRTYEEITRIEFDKVAKSTFPNASLVWDEVPQHLEPPDWYLTLGNIRYAVEATTVVDFLSITPDSKLSAVNVSSTLFAFIKDVEKSAKDQEILSGAYIVTLCPIPNFSQNRKKLCDDLLDYIRQTKSLPSAPEFTLGYVRQQRVSIKKEHNNKDYVSAGLSMGVKWEGDAQEDLLQSISNALAEKVYKLRAVSQPIILLLLDEFHYSFMADWTSIISSCSDRVHFCCICRILPPDNSVILWANSPEWKAIATG
jgi:hypothetical protein